MDKLFNATQRAKICPDCQGELVVREGQYGLFNGCSNYPTCRYLQPLGASFGQIINYIKGKYCPECANVLVLRQGRFGMFIGCSNYPHCHYVESQRSDEPELNITCPLCKKGKLIQRQARSGKYFYACDNYPSCRFTLNSTPVAACCLICRYPLLMQKKGVRAAGIVCANKYCEQKGSKTK